MWQNERGRLFLKETLNLEVVFENILKNSFPIISDTQGLLRISTPPEIAVRTHFHVISIKPEIAAGTHSHGQYDSEVTSKF